MHDARIHLLENQNTNPEWQVVKVELPQVRPEHADRFLEDALAFDVEGLIGSCCQVSEKLLAAGHSETIGHASRNPREPSSAALPLAAPASQRG